MSSIPIPSNGRVVAALIRGAELAEGIARVSAPDRCPPRPGAWTGQPDNPRHRHSQTTTTRVVKPDGRAYSFRLFPGPFWRTISFLFADGLPDLRRASALLLPRIEIWFHGQVGLE
jgi:hypothetical protein